MNTSDNATNEGNKMTKAEKELRAKINAAWNKNDKATADKLTAELHQKFTGKYAEQFAWKKF